MPRGCLWTGVRTWLISATINYVHPRLWPHRWMRTLSILMHALPPLSTVRGTGALVYELSLPLSYLRSFYHGHLSAGVHETNPLALGLSSSRLDRQTLALNRLEFGFVLLHYVWYAPSHVWTISYRSSAVSLHWHLDFGSTITIALPAHSTTTTTTSSCTSLKGDLDIFLRLARATRRGLEPHASTLLCRVMEMYTRVWAPSLSLAPHKIGPS